METVKETIKTIPFFVTVPDEHAEDEEKSIFGKFRADAEVELKPIPTDRLKKSLTGVSEAVLTVIKDIKQVGQFKLKEITLQVEVSAEGGINLIGTATLGGKGAITLKFGE